MPHETASLRHARREHTVSLKQEIRRRLDKINDILERVSNSSGAEARAMREEAKRELAEVEVLQATASFKRG